MNFTEFKDHCKKSADGFTPWQYTYIIEPFYRDAPMFNTENPKADFAAWFKQFVEPFRAIAGELSRLHQVHDDVTRWDAQLKVRASNLDDRQQTLDDRERKIHERAKALRQTLEAC